MTVSRLLELVTLCSVIASMVMSFSYRDSSLQVIILIWTIILVFVYLYEKEENEKIETKKIKQIDQKEIKENVRKDGGV